LAHSITTSALPTTPRPTAGSLNDVCEAPLVFESMTAEAFWKAHLEGSMHPWLWLAATASATCGLMGFASVGRMAAERDARTARTWRNCMVDKLKYK